MLNELAHIFSNSSKNLNRWPDCAEPMINAINASNPSCVLDLGCGANLYKEHIPNLTGIDIATHEADITCMIEDLPVKDSSVDVCICMGSVNFGTEAIIRAQLEEIKRVTRDKGTLYFRVACNHNHHLYYPWDEEKAHQYANEYNFTFVDGPREIFKTEDDRRENTVGDRGKHRLYWVWQVNK